MFKATATQPTSSSSGTTSLPESVGGTPTRRHRWARRGVVAVATTAASLALAVSGAPAAHAAPISGATPWLLLLCKPSDRTPEPHPPSYYRHLIAEHDAVNPTLWDYWWDVSNYNINLFYSGASPKWVTTNRTLANLKTESREQKLQDCMKAAGPDIANPDTYYGLIAVWNVNFTEASDPPKANFGDSGATGTGPVTRTLNNNTKPYAGIVMEPWAMLPSILEHEMGHGYGLEHAFSLGGCGKVDQFGEYCDPYDAMGSYEYSFPQPANGGAAGPGLSAFNLDKLGFIPAARKVELTPSVTPVKVAIRSLSTPSASGYLMVKVPLGDNPDHYYTIEYRRRLGWDAGLNMDGVVIHEVKPDAVKDHTTPLSYEVPRDNWLDAVWSVGENFHNNNPHSVDITVASIDPANNFAVVSISTPAPVPPTTAPTYGSSGSGGCGTGCGAHPPGWRPHPIQFA